MNLAGEADKPVTLQNGNPVNFGDLHAPFALPSLTPAQWRFLAMARLKASPEIVYRFIDGSTFSNTEAVDQIANNTELGNYFISVQKRAIEIVYAVASGNPP